MGPARQGCGLKLKVIDPWKDKQSEKALGTLKRLWGSGWVCFSNWSQMSGMGKIGSEQTGWELRQELGY